MIGALIAYSVVGAVVLVLAAYFWTLWRIYKQTFGDKS